MVGTELMLVFNFRVFLLVIDLVVFFNTCKFIAIVLHKSLVIHVIVVLGLATSYAWTLILVRELITEAAIVSVVNLCLLVLNPSH